MKELSLTEMKSIQLLILDEVHRYCGDNNLQYFLSSGTLIGAVRHKGYIPWDDDIDLYMPRKDYDWFLFNFNNQKDKRYRVNEVRLNQGFSQSFIKVDDESTLIVDPKSNSSYELGVNIDIFPLDYVPDNDSQLSILFKLKNFMYSISTAKLVPLSSLKMFHSKRWRLFVVMSRMIPLSPSQINKCIIRMVKNENRTSRVCNIAGNGPLSARGCFSSAAIDSSIDIEFEGKLYKTMCGYKEYLTNTYGDFMVLPPEEKRVPSHLTKAFAR